MSDAIFSPFWYRVSALKPKLRSHIRIHRHSYRGQVRYVLEDRFRGRHHQLTPESYFIISRMDGDRDLNQIWESASDRLGDDAPGQEEMIRLLGRLHAADILVCDIPPDSLELFRRSRMYERQKWMQRLAYPLAIRFPLIDPEPFLARWQFLVRPLFGPVGFVLWGLVVVAGALAASGHWPELSSNVIDRVLTTENLLILWLVYPVVKILHEFGHAFATRVWGGEVHEMGMMLLVLMPIPYVEASSASAFPQKHRRIIVGAAGIMVELFLASVAMFVWTNAEPGIIRTIAWNVMLIGGISTLFFNGNPLLRFDGYYILSDAIEIPNLATRANQYVAYLFQRYLFGVSDAVTPVSAHGERAWFLFYGIASFLYRMFILFVITLFVAGKFPVVGVLMAIWAVAVQIALPLWRALSFVVSGPVLAHRRIRAVTTSIAGTGLLAALLFMLPAPLWTQVEGIVWVQEKSQIRAGADGLVVRMLARDGAFVRTGQPLVEIEEPLLDARIRVLTAELQELESRLTGMQFSDRPGAEMVRQEMQSVAADLDRAHELYGELILKSPNDGILVVPRSADLPGQYLHRGQVVGYVVNDDMMMVRAAVSQSDAGLMREGIDGVEVLVDDWDAAPLGAVLQREVPGATNHLPGKALGAEGGGSFAVDPRDEKGLTTLENILVFDILVPDIPVERIGGRVLVRFDHGTEPLGFQWYRSLRQVFLSRFEV